MAPKIKVTKKDIIETAIELIRKNGEGTLNARNIAAALNCSTQPIFSNFMTMEELQSEVLNSIYEKYLGFLDKEANSGKYPQYKAYGMAYIRFAKEEKELFKLLFMRDRTGEKMAYSSDFEKSVEMIMKSNGVNEDTANLMHLEMWSCVHGIGTMLATSFFELDWDKIGNILTDVYQGIRAKHVSEENK